VLIKGLEVHIAVLWVLMPYNVEGGSISSGEHIASIFRTNIHNYAVIMPDPISYLL
jgi:hypothetical protein